MITITIKILTNNDSFKNGNDYGEINQILKDSRRKILDIVEEREEMSRHSELKSWSKSLKDSNGNPCGVMTIKFSNSNKLRKGVNEDD